MANKRKTLYLTGTLHWAKVIGAPRPNYDGDAREWTFELEPDAESAEALEDEGLGDRLRDKRDKKGYEDRGKFIILKRSEFKVDGEANEPIRIVDADNQPWNGALIGNGTEADVKVTVVDYGRGKKQGIYPVAIRVLEHVPFEREEFAPLPEDDNRRQKAAARRKSDHDQFKEDFKIEDEPEQEPAPAKKAKRIPDAELDDDVDF